MKARTMSTQYQRMSYVYPKFCGQINQAGVSARGGPGSYALPRDLRVVLGADSCSEGESPITRPYLVHEVPYGQHLAVVCNWDVLLRLGGSMSRQPCLPETETASLDERAPG